MRTSQLSLAVMMIAGLTGCNTDSGTSSNKTPYAESDTYQAQIVRTDAGTAHIQATDYGSLGFGQGYAFSEDRFCMLMDQVVKVRGTRAKFFGTGDQQQHLISDLAYKALDLQTRAELEIDDLEANPKAMLQGYVAGVNKYLADTGTANLAEECRSAEWVSNISAQDLMAYYLDIATLAGVRNFLPAIANAQPPASSSMVAGYMPQSFGKISKDHASNGIAVGKELTGKAGALLSNTHLPWEDELLYHEVHLTIPGEIDVAGVALSAAMGVQIGFNNSMAWTHTTSPSNQFIIYNLTLDPSSPTKYMVDGVSKDMTQLEVSVEVKGMEQPITQTFYNTEYGPVLEYDAAGLGWNASNAFAIYDMNIDNGGFLATFIKMAKAKTVDELRSVFQQNGGVPWNHTMATDSQGKTFYADTTFIPNLSPLVEQGYFNIVNNPTTAQEMLVAGAYQKGLVLLDGSSSMFKPFIRNGARVPASVPFNQAPQVSRFDYVMNSNDSYWLPNSKSPLNNLYSGFYGDNGKKMRSFRTRMGLKQISELESGKVTGKSLQDLLFANRSFTAELWRNDICQGISGQTLEDACDIITNTWDGKLDTNSQGAHVFRETMSVVKNILSNGEIVTAVDAMTGQPTATVNPFTAAYDKHDPMNTPSGLSAAGKGLFQSTLASAITRLNDNNIALDAKLGDIQFTMKGDEKIAIHGGLQKIDGAFNKVEYRRDSNMYTTLLPHLDRATVVNNDTNLTESGYMINYGASYVMTVDFSSGSPDAEAILVYSQSSDKTSNHFSDQTKAYSEKSWRAVPFTVDQVKNSLVSQKIIQVKK